MFVWEFNFDVGNKEKHSISFRYSKWMGDIEVKCDGKELARTSAFFIGQNPILNASVGTSEKHDLRFDIRPNGLFFMKPTISVFVDKKLYKDY